MSGTAAPSPPYHHYTARGRGEAQKLTTTRMPATTWARTSLDDDDSHEEAQQHGRRDGESGLLASRQDEGDSDDEDNLIVTKNAHLDDDDDEDAEADGTTIFSDRAAAAGLGDGADDDKTISTAPPRRSRPRNRGRRTTPSPIHQIYSITKEALPTLLLSLISLIFSGEVLVHLARWPVFLKVDKLFILIPILLNLKGNLEMNLSLRMSTSANIGELDIRRTRETLIVGNMTLLQVQALIVSAGAGVVAFALGVVADRREGGVPPIATPASTPTLTAPPTLTPRRIIHHHPKPPVDPTLRMHNGYFEFVLVLATGMLSASLSSAVLGNFMCALVVVARRLGANPDNIASPLAASLGDLLTLTLVGLVASSLVRFEGTGLATVIFVLLMAACGVCFFVTRKNSYVKELLSSGWVPLILAMFISSGAGLVLDSFVQEFEGFALLVPVITGLPGACAAILVSRTSTQLHAGKGEVALRDQHEGQHHRRHGSGGFFSLDGSSTRRHHRGPLAFLHRHLIHPLLTLSRPPEGYLIPATLLTLGLLIELLFLLVVFLTSQLTFSWPFALCFSLASLLALGFALALAHAMTMELWKRDYDPDIYCLPFVSSIVDVVGQALLVGAYSVARGVAGDVVRGKV